MVTTMADDGEERDERSAYPAFRQRLDAVLRQRDPAALRAFLIAEGQWQPDQQTDDEAAMWMMIAASPTLAGMHAEARRWLASHGHEAEARAILGRGQTQRQEAAPRRGSAGRQHSRPAGGRHGTRDAHGGRGGHGQRQPPRHT